MLSLCCVVVCVLAQLINSTVHPAAILVRKRRVVDFMERDLRVTEFAQFLQSRGKDGNRDGCISFPVFLLEARPLPCIHCSVIRLSVFRIWVFHSSSYFSLAQIFFLPRAGFAAVIRPLFNQFLGGHSVKGNNCPICVGVYDWVVPDIRRD